MTVHLQIAEQVRKHREAQKIFLTLDAEREKEIEEMLALAKAGHPIEIVKVNEITNEMNKLATQFQFPPRKNITIDMVQEYLAK